MAQSKVVGITIDIVGKNSMSKSLSEIDKSLQSTKSALKDVNKALELDPTNVELATQKQELLTKQIQETKEALKIMESAAEEARKGLENGTVSREKYAQLTAEIVKTNASLQQLESEAQGTAGGMEEVGVSTGEASDNMEELDNASEDTSGHLEALKAVAITVGAEMVAAFAAAVTAAKEVGEALVNCTVDASAYADEVLTLSTVTGISTEKLQELQYSAELVDVSVETITGSMTKNLRAMDSASSGTGAAAEAYAKLGISVTDANGNLRDDEEVYWEVIDALGQITNESERDAIAMDLLGKSAQDLNPLIEAGSETMADLAQQAHDTGYVMEGDTLEAFGAFDDQLQLLNNNSTSAKNALGMILLPALTDLAGTGNELLGEFAKGVSDSGGSVDGLSATIRTVLPKAIKEISSQAPQILSMILEVTDSIIDVVIDNLDLIIDSALQIIDALVTGLLSSENLQKIIDAAFTLISRLAEFLLQNLPIILQAGIDLLVTLMNGFAEAAPQLIPAVIDAILLICETLLAPENLEMLLQATLSVILAVAQALLEDLPYILESVISIVTSVVGWLLTDGIAELASAGFELLVSLVQELPSALSEIMSGIGGICDEILGAFTEMGEGIDAVWDGIWGFIKDIINTIIGGINGMIYGFESAINFCIDAINSLSWTVPDWVPWVGGDTFGFDLSHVDFGRIPLLAQGAVIPPNNPFLAVLGDQSSGTNIEAPLETIKQALAEVMTTGEQQIIIPINIGQERIETIVARANTVANYQSGGY